ncbi:putative regulator protein [Streptantibioticus cattleyicolor NRRL 8057 = DSM 46488]|nr:putative regulator protein [Streptantibioticus cattleyicolor NRRL 8057 = DSM 46488]
MLSEGPGGRHWLAAAADEAFPLGELGHGATGFAACALGADPQATGEARQFTRRTLGGWGLATVVDDVAVVVSELLSNALRYGVAGPRGRRASARPVWLGLLRRDRTVLCAVCDPNPEVPVIRKPDYFAESGRGLHVIDALSDSWGWTTPDASGKAVWAALTAR